MVKREAPDVVHSYLDTANVLTILLRGFFPRLAVVWGVRASYVDWQEYDWLSKATFRLSCRLARYADLINVNSIAGREHHVAQGYPAGKMRIIANGIDTDFFYPDRQAGDDLRREWGIAEDAIVIGIVARLDPMKDHNTFLRAAEALAATRDDVVFVCVGDGVAKFREQLTLLAQKLGVSSKVRWHRSAESMRAVYNAMDVVTLSSIGEGFPNVLAEAMACGTPCVTTDVGDARRIVGDLGVVVPPRDPQRLADGWREMLRRKYESIDFLGDELRSRICSEFSRDLLVARTLEALTEVTGVRVVSASKI